MVQNKFAYRKWLGSSAITKLMLRAELYDYTPVFFYWYSTTGQPNGLLISATTAWASIWLKVRDSYVFLFLPPLSICQCKCSLPWSLNVNRWTGISDSCLISYIHMTTASLIFYRQEKLNVVSLYIGHIYVKK